MDFSKEFRELDEKLIEASALVDVTPMSRPEALRARTDEYVFLIKKQISILELYAKYVEERTEKLLSKSN